MKRTPISQFPHNEIEDLLSNVVFFKQLNDIDPNQYNKLLSLTHIIDLEPREVIIQKGTIDKNFYSVVSGKLNVFTDEVNDQPIGWIAAGQVIGALSLINNQPRTATLASSVIHGTRLLETDFTLFGRLTDFKGVTLATKLCFYKNVVEHTRQKLESYKLQSGDIRLTEELSTFSHFDGEPNSLDELEYLSELIRGLSWLLASWNETV